MRVVDEMVEAIPDVQLFAYYSGGGRSSYHPKMMLKVILYAYSQKVYACRGIERLIRENLPAMWLAAMQTPDFRTINDFRGIRMKAMMDELFETMILKLIEDKHITMENYFLDGTKIEVESAFGHIKGNRSFRRFLLRGLEKVHTEFGIVALAHNLLKLAGIRQLISGQSQKDTKTDGEKLHIFLHRFYFEDLSDIPSFNRFLLLAPRSLHCCDVFEMIRRACRDVQAVLRNSKWLIGCVEGGRRKTPLLPLSALFPSLHDAGYNKHRKTLFFYQC